MFLFLLLVIKSGWLFQTSALQWIRQYHAGAMISVFGEYSLILNEMKDFKKSI